MSGIDNEGKKGTGKRAEEGGEGRSQDGEKKMGGSDMA